MRDGLQRGRSKSKLFSGVLWALVVAAALWIAFGLLWRDDPATDDPLSGWIAFAALFSDAFRFHFGFVLLGLVAIAALARRRMAVLALCVLLIPTIGARVAMLLDRDWHTRIGGPTLTVFSANLLYGRGDDAGLIDQIRASDPDMVLLQEYTPGESSLAGLLRETYPHAVEVPRTDAAGMAVFSKSAFVGTPVVRAGVVGSRMPTIMCEVEVGGERVAVWNVHMPPPIGGRGTAEQRKMIAWIAGQAEAVLSDPRGPAGLVIAGDFNATSGTNHLREIRDAGLVEAHAERGTGPGVTWPVRGWKGRFPGIRIDHVFAGGRAEPVSAAVGERFGSDHLPVVGVVVIVSE